MVLAAFLVGCLPVFALALWGYAESRRFLREVPRIDSPEALAAFKTLARRNMVGALVMLGIGIPWALGAIYLVTSAPLGEKIAAGVALALFGLVSRRGQLLEAAARSLPADTGFAIEYERVGKTWVGKALPDF